MSFAERGLLDRRPPPYYKQAGRTTMKKPTLDIYAGLRLDASCEINEYCKNILAARHELAAYCACFITSSTLA
jgi:hypothetical protein